MYIVNSPDEFTQAMDEVGHKILVINGRTHAATINEVGMPILIGRNQTPLANKIIPIDLMLAHGISIPALVMRQADQKLVTENAAAALLTDPEFIRENPDMSPARVQRAFLSEKGLLQYYVQITFKKLKSDLDALRHDVDKTKPEALKNLVDTPCFEDTVVKAR